MASEKLKEWIKDKRQKGISDERIRESLEKAGRDPDMLDEVDDPFDSDKDRDVSEDLFSSSEDKVSKTESFDSSTSQEENGSNSAKENKDVEKTVSSSETKSALTRVGQRFSKNKKSEVLSFKLFSNHVSSKQTGIFLFILLVLVIGIGTYSFTSDSIDTDLLVGSTVDSSTNLDRLQSLDEKHAGCPAGGVRIEDISTSEGSTNVDVLVTQKAWVVVEIINKGKVIGFSTQNVEGNTVISVDKIGKEANLRPLGCESYKSRRSY